MDRKLTWLEQSAPLGTSGSSSDNYYNLSDMKYFNLNQSDMSEYSRIMKFNKQTKYKQIHWLLL